MSSVPASEILYGASPRSRQENSFYSLPLDLKALNLIGDETVFQHQLGFSGSWGWAIKSERFPRHWGVKLAEERTAYQAISLIHQAETAAEVRYPCQLRLLDDGRTEISWSAADDARQSKIAARAISQRIAAILQAKYIDASWQILFPTGHSGNCNVVLHYASDTNPYDVHGVIGLSTAYDGKRLFEPQAPQLDLAQVVK